MRFRSRAAIGCRAVGLVLVVALTAGACGSDATDETVENPPAPSVTLPPPVSAPTSTTHAEVETPATQPPEPETPVRLRAASADDPLRVMSVGDSVTFDADPGIAAAFESTGVVHYSPRSIGGVGVARPEFDQFLSEGLLDVQPEVLVVMLGGWDLGEARDDPDGYDELVDAAVGRMLSVAELVIWLGMPPTPPGEGIEGLRAIVNDAYERAAERWGSSVVYVSTDAAMGEPDGQFARFLDAPDGTRQQARKVRDGGDDGHLCPGGAAILGSLALDVFIEAAAVERPPFDWIYGDWRGESRYDDPDGACVAVE